MRSRGSRGSRGETIIYSCFLCLLFSFLTFALRPSPFALSDVKFTDVTQESGITFRHFNGAAGKRYLPETMGSGASFFDYDTDGDLDIYIVNGSILNDDLNNVGNVGNVGNRTPPTDVLYRNDGDGRFTDVTQLAGLVDTVYGMGCAVGDYNNDGFSDLYVTNFGANVLYKNNGDGTFSEGTQAAKVDDPRWSSSAAFFDYDNDGDLDLYVTNYLDYRFELNKLCGLPEIPTYCGPLYYDGSPDTLYQNDGDGTFSDVTQQAGVYDLEGKGLGVVCGDYNNDGFIDLFIANDTSPNFLYKNSGNGTFTEVALLAGVAYNEDGAALAGMGGDFGDYDNDGLMDILVTNFSYEHNSLYRNLGDGTFKNMIHEAGMGEASYLPLGFGTGFLDYDNDGFLDIFVANGHILDNINMFADNLTYAQRPQLFHNNMGNRGLQLNAPTPTPTYTYVETSEKSGEYFNRLVLGRGVAFGDYDNDGDVDIFVVHLNDQPALLRNDGGNSNHWLMVHTVGTKSNRDGIGARVKLVSKSGAQLREVKAAYSYLSSNDPRLLFGLGDDNKVDLLQIRWPSGVVQELRNLDSGQIIKVIERR